MANPKPTRQRGKSDAMSDRMKAKLGTFVQRQRDPNEAAPRHINTFAGKNNRYTLGDGDSIGCRSL